MTINRVRNRSIR